jgi:hypothetical protein
MAEKILFQTKLVQLDKVDKDGVGTIRRDEFGRAFRYTKNRNATAFTAKQPVCFDVGNVGTFALLKSVNSPVTADLMVQAGIAMTAIAASGGDCFGWVQQLGYFQDARVVGVSGTAIAVGDELVAANAATTLTRATAVGTAPKRQFTFQALEAVSAATAIVYAKDVYINCL